MQIAQRRYDETRSRVHAQRARQEQKKQQGTALQRIAGGLSCSDAKAVQSPLLNLCRLNCTKPFHHVLCSLRQPAHPTVAAFWYNCLQKHA